MEDQQSDFGAFVSACFKNWIGLVAGAILAGIAVAAYAQSSAIQVDWPIYAGVIAVVLAIEAPFLAFKTERRARLSTRGSRAEKAVDDEPFASVVDAPPQIAPDAAPTAPTLVASAAAPPVPARPMLLEFTAKDLVDLRSDESDADAEKTTSVYVGKRLEAMLVVSKISDYAPGNCVFVYGRTSDTPAASATDSASEWTNLTCTFDRSRWLTHLETRRAGDALQVAGEVKDIDTEGVGLIRCELLGNQRTGSDLKRPTFSA